MRYANTSKVEARNLEVGMRFMSDNRWRNINSGQSYKILDIETFGEGRDMRYVVRANSRTLLQMRAHEKLDVIS